MIEQISIPEGLKWNCFSRQKIVRIEDVATSGAELLDRLKYSLKYSRRADHAESVIEFSDLSVLERLSQLRRHLPKVRMIVSEDQMGELHRNRARLSAFCPTLVLDRCESSLPRSVQFMASLNLPIEVTPSVFMSTDEKSLLDLGERLLFSPFVKIPVHPFFGLLQAALDAGNSSFFVTLWDICGENPGQHYYITNDGKITLSKLWADENRFFGNVFDTIDDIHESDFFRELIAIKETCIRISHECSNCPVLRFCAGYLRAVNSTYDCSPFVSLYKFMCSHVSSLRENYTALTNQKKRDILQVMDRPVQRAFGRYPERRTHEPGLPGFLMFRKTKSKLPKNEQ